MSEILIVQSKEELLDFGYKRDNVGKEVIYEGKTFVLSRVGYVMQNMDIFCYANQPLIPISQQPIWSLTIGELTMSVINII